MWHKRQRHEVHTSVDVRGQASILHRVAVGISLECTFSQDVVLYVHVQWTASFGRKLCSGYFKS